ncbi:MAG: alpha/beta hydrolase [Sphaerochaetaceae bacterium]
MAICTISTANLYYEIIGNGPLVVLVAGLGSDSSSWLPVVKQLQDSYTCLIYDHRGLGKSSLGNSEHPYDIELLTADLEELLTALNWNQVHLVGQSMGGVVAQAYAIRYPKRLLSLALHVTWARLRPRLRLIFEEQLYYLDLLEIQDVIRLLGPYIWSNTILGEHKEMLESFREQRRELLPPSKDVYRKQLGICLAYDGLDAVSQIQVPVLVTGANEDFLVTADHCQEIAKRIPHATYHAFEKYGHAVSFEGVEDFCLLTKNFIRKIEGVKA